MSDVTLWKNISGLGVGTYTLISEEFDLGGYTAADTFNVIKIPAHSIVLAAVVEITEDAGETCTVDVGITGTDVDCFVDGANMNGTAGTMVGGALQGAYITTPTVLHTATIVTVLTVTGSTYAAGKGKVHLLLARL